MNENISQKTVDDYIQENESPKSNGILARQQTICGSNILSSDENRNQNQDKKECEIYYKDNLQQDQLQDQLENYQLDVENQQNKKIEKKIRFILPPKGFRYYYSKEEKEGIIFHYQNKEINQLKNPVNIMEREISCYLNSLIARPSFNKGFLMSKSIDNFYKLNSVFIVYNPVAGNNQKRNQQILKKFQHLLLKNNIKIKQIITSQNENDIEQQIIKNSTILNKVDTIVCIGGDGTLNDIINGLMKRSQQILNSQNNIIVSPNGNKKYNAFEYQSPKNKKNNSKIDRVIQEYQVDQQQPCIAIIPTGTNNHTSNNYHNKKQDYKFNYNEIMQNIISSFKPYYLDIIEIIYKNPKFEQFEKTYTQQGVYWGLIQKTLSNYSKSYILSKNTSFDIQTKFNMMKNISQEVYLKIDEQDQDFKFQTNCLMIQNNQYGLSRKKIAPFAQMNDGFLDLVIFDNLSKCDTSGYFEEMERGGSHIYQQNLISGQFKSLQLFTKIPSYIQIDEKKQHMMSPITINVLQKKIKIIY